jgi:serpin B
VNLKGIFLGLAAGLLLVACGSDQSGSEVRLVRADVGRIESPDATEEEVAQLVRGNNAFAFEMYRTGGGDGNLIFSPYSISLAFSMAYAGAQGETEGQMAETLNYQPQDAQHPAFNALEQLMSGLGEKGAGAAVPFRLNVANSAWGQQGYSFEDAYLGTLASHYGAGLRTLDFGQPQEAAGEINAWIEDQTEDRIKNLVSSDAISPATRLVLGNAIYFKASWLSRFEPSNTEDGPFTLADGSRVTVPLMQQTAYFPYMEGDGYQAVRLPYKGEAADMLIILPQEGRFEQVEGRLGAGFLDEVRRGLREEYVRLTMPRFDFETDLDLPKLLKAMGMTAPFDSGIADFSGITGKKELYISEALHRADITVDEKGTEAAAATVLGMALSAAPEPTEMTADRPFIFAIAERETGAILFLGRVTDPSS